MATKPYPKQISDAQVMLAGLKANEAQLSARGITAEFIAQLETSINEAVEKNNEQEKLKADLKTITADLNATLKTIAGMMSESSVIVKLEIPPEQWKEFGITAKR